MFVCECPQISVRPKNFEDDAKYEWMNCVEFTLEKESLDGREISKKKYEFEESGRIKKDSKKFVVRERMELSGCTIRAMYKNSQSRRSSPQSPPYSFDVGMWPIFRKKCINSLLI